MIVMGLFLGACNAEIVNNQAVEDFAIEMEEADLGVVIHNVDPNELATLNVAEYTVEPVEESFLFVPQYLGSHIVIYEVSWEKDKLATKDVLFELDDIKNRDVLYLKCPVPEGIPMMKVVITYEDQSSEYVITYDGSGMREQIEILTANVE